MSDITDDGAVTCSGRCGDRVATRLPRRSAWASSNGNEFVKYETIGGGPAKLRFAI